MKKKTDKKNVKAFSAKDAATEYQGKLESYKPSFLRSVKNVDLAKMIAKTDDKKSKVYKNALRNVQKWKKGTTKPSKKSQSKIIDHIKEDSKLSKKLFRPSRGINVSIYGQFTISEDIRYRTISHKLTPSQSQTFLDLSSKNAQEGLDYFYGVYGVYPSSLTQQNIIIEEV